MAERSFQRRAAFNFPLRRDVLAQIKDQNRSCWLQFLVTSTIFKEERYALRIGMATLVSAWGCVLSTGTVPGNLLQGMMLWDRKITVRHQKLFTTPTKQSQGSAEVSPPPNYLQYTQLLSFKIQLFGYIILFLKKYEGVISLTHPHFHSPISKRKLIGFLTNSFVRCLIVRSWDTEGNKRKSQQQTEMRTPSHRRH